MLKRTEAHKCRQLFKVRVAKLLSPSSVYIQSETKPCKDRSENQLMRLVVLSRLDCIKAANNNLDDQTETENTDSLQRLLRGFVFTSTYWNVLLSEITSRRYFLKQQQQQWNRQFAGPLHGSGSWQFSCSQKTNHYHPHSLQWECFQERSWLPWRNVNGIVPLARRSISHAKYKVRIETTEKQNNKFVWNGMSSLFGFGQIIRTWCTIKRWLSPFHTIPPLYFDS